MKSKALSVSEGIKNMWMSTVYVGKGGGEAPDTIHPHIILMEQSYLVYWIMQQANLDQIVKNVHTILFNG